MNHLNCCTPGSNIIRDSLRQYWVRESPVVGRSMDSWKIKIKMDDQNLINLLVALFGNEEETGAAPEGYW